MCESHDESGAIVSFDREPMALSPLYAHRRNLRKRVRVFMDWIAEILWPVLAH
jgi:hypothetical protein